MEESTALSDIKNGMTAGVPYALVVSVFLYFYYSKIDPDFNRHQIAEAEMSISKMLDDEKELQKLKDTNAEFEVMSKEELYEELSKGPKNFYNPTSTMTVSLLSLLLLATLNSIFVTIVYRKIVFRTTRNG
jgi:hypothetical protein